MNQIKNDLESLMFLKKGAWFSGWVKYQKQRGEKRGKDVGGSAGWKRLMILTEFSGEFLSHDSAKLQSEVTHFICLFLRVYMAISFPSTRTFHQDASCMEKLIACIAQLGFWPILPQKQTSNPERSVAPFMNSEL